MFVVAHTGLGLPSRLAITPSDLKDGISQTDAFSEGLAGLAYPTRLRTIWNNDRDLTISSNDEIRAYWNALPNDPAAKGWQGTYMTKGRGWSSIFTAPLYNHVSNPNEVSGYAGAPFPDEGDPKEGTLAASSAHSGGVNVLAADGHVQFIQNGIDIQVWRARGTRNGHENVTGSE